LVKSLLPFGLAEHCSNIHSKVAEAKLYRLEAELINLAICESGPDKYAYLETAKSALKQYPNNAEIFSHYLQGLVFTNEFQLAFDAVEAFKDKNKTSYFLEFNTAVLLRRIGRLKAAIEHYDFCIKTYGANRDLYYNVANALEENGSFDGAIENYKKAISLDPQDTKLHVNLAEAYSHIGDMVSARQSFGRALQINPHLPDAKFGLAVLDLNEGNFHRGWIGYEERWKDEIFLNAERKQSQPYQQYITYPHDKRELENKSILIVTEQGVGDAIMFLSILDDLRKLANSVSVVFDSRLKGIFSKCFSDVSFFSFQEFTPENSINYDVVVRSGRLGYLFRNSREAFSGKPYLQPSDEAKSYISTRLKEIGVSKPCIGLSWRGGTSASRNVHRSMTLLDLKEIISLEEFDFINIQYGDVNDEIENFFSATGKRVFQLAKDEFDDFDRLAALIDQLSLVITVQNTNVHVCGAIGKKCWAMLPRSPEWRYGLNGKKMAWYNSVELIRQSDVMNWTSVIDEVYQKLKEFGSLSGNSK
jgi:tetratricopeptide (TPR) repeat protein